MLDHVTGEGARGTALAGKAYGSVMKQNFARYAVEVKADKDAGPNLVQTGLFTTKSNRTGLGSPLGLQFDFGDPPAVHITRADVRESPSLGAAASSALPH